MVVLTLSGWGEGGKVKDERLEWRAVEESEKHAGNDMVTAAHIYNYKVRNVTPMPHMGGRQSVPAS